MSNIDSTVLAVIDETTNEASIEFADSLFALTAALLAERRGDATAEQVALIEALSASTIWAEPERLIGGKFASADTIAYVVHSFGGAA